jgi:hypothetical protein
MKQRVDTTPATLLALLDALDVTGATLVVHDFGGPNRYRREHRISWKGNATAPTLTGTA